MEIQDMFRYAFSKLCPEHIDKMVNQWRSQGAPLMNLAEPRFRALVSDAALEQLIATALTVPQSGKGYGPIPVGKIDNWYVMVSVFPSTSAQQIRSTFTDNSYEEFACDLRDNFRQTIPDHATLDYNTPHN